MTTEQNNNLPPKDFAIENIKKLVPGLNKLSKNEQNSIVSFFLRHQRIEISQTSGPIPSASELERYQNLYPRAAEIIFTEMEKEQSHRHLLEKRDSGRDSKGQIFAFILALFVFSIGGFLVYSGSPTAGTIICGANLVTIVLAFISNKSKMPPLPKPLDKK